MRYCLLSIVYTAVFGISSFFAQQNAKVHPYILEKLELIKETSKDSVRSIYFNEISVKSGELKQVQNQISYADSALYYAKKANAYKLYLRSITSKINGYITKQDTTKVSQLFSKGFQFATEYNIKENHPDFLKFRIREIYFKIRQGNITSKEGLDDYLSMYKNKKISNLYDIKTDLAGRISLLYRNRKELGKALKYNNLEVDFAKLSNNPRAAAAAKITELDLSYQLIPRPIQSKDVQPLIKKAKLAEQYMQQHEILDILPFAKLYLAKFYIHENNYRKSENLLLSISDSASARVVFSKYEQLSEIAKSVNNLKKYRIYTSKFKPIAYKTKRPFVALNVHNYLLDYFTKVNSLDSASFYAKKLENNLQQVDTTQFLDYVYFSYDALANHYRKINQQKSLQYKTYANNITQQIVANQKEAFVNLIKYKEEVENLQDKNENLTSAIAVFKSNLSYIIAVVILLLGFTIYYFKAFKKSDKKSKAIAEEKEQIIEKVAKKSIVLQNKQKLYLENIKYIKADRNYVEYFYNDKKMIDRNHLKNVLEQLPPNFIKVHRSFIINKNYIKVINSSSVILNPNIEIPVSRTFKTNLKI